MKTFKTGIIGCGKQAEKHIQSLRKIADVEFILADAYPELAEKMGGAFQVPWVKTPDALFEIVDLDAVLVCTPTPTHAQLIEKSLVAGKSVFCEKPLCENLEEATRLKELEATANIPILVGYLYRFVPVFETGLSLINSTSVTGNASILGKPLSAFFRVGGRGSHQLWKHLKNQGGGAINEMLVHMIDLANWYFGPLSDVEVLSKKLKCPERVIQGKTEKVDAEDYLMIQAVGAGDTEIVCQADLITPAFNQYVEIQCENGSFMGSILKDMPSYVFLKEARADYPAGKTLLTNGRRSFLDIQMEYFYKCVTEKTTPDRNRIEDSIELMTIIESIRKQ